MSFRDLLLSWNELFRIPFRRKTTGTKPFYNRRVLQYIRMIMSDFSKPYNAKELEERIYDKWVASGFFTPENLPDADKREPFTIIMPPPNVTGTLHVGHALMLVLQDILVRFNRMKGRKTLWLPGTDHAAIATQAKVEEILYKKEQKTRHDYERNEFLAIVEKFAQESHDTIVNQVKKMGSSCDWTREAYTLDEKRSLAVRTAFKRMYEEKLIYRGARIVNWDPKLQTTVSDDEVEWKEEKTPLYYIQYGPFVIATARPETKFGDKYVVMHPDDERYKQYANGQKIEVEWINGQITATVVKDTAVDMSFGTGVMTITPWHDAIDFEIAERHNLEHEQIIDFQAKLLPIAEEFAGMHIKKARPLIVEKLKQKGLLVKTEEEYTHRIAGNSRGGGIIEPQIKEQWFINVNAPFTLPHPNLEGILAGSETTLKKIMRMVVKTGQIKIIPDHFEKIYFHWIDNLRDWCISRQIWYGHRIPVWYCVAWEHKENNAEKMQKCLEPIVSIKDVVKCPHCGSAVKQDPDTLDTWFSSGLWTFSTLGWPEKTSDLDLYHPTDVMETGYDILFFWVARMVLMTTYHLGDIPFKTVYLHGLVRDERRQKMSKSKGNALDPLELSGTYGTDALRMALIVGNTPGADMALSEDKIRGYKNFANKIWNASRFVLGNIEHTDLSEEPKLAPKDAETLAELYRVAKEITNDMEQFRFYLAAEKIYHYVWHTFADIIIEETKQRLRSENAQETESARRMLYEMLVLQLKLLHPFMPFVTEAVWEQMPQKNKTLLMIEPWPHS